MPENEMSHLVNDDLRWCLVRLPKRIFNYMKQDKSVLLAGGYIRACIANEKVSDIDLFSETKQEAELHTYRLAKPDERIIETENAFSIIGKSTTIQFIHKWTYKEPRQILPSFDFTIARAVIWHNGEQWKSLCDNRFYADLAAKRLVYCSPVRIEEAGGSLLRVLKFYQRGYRIPLDSLAGTVARLMTAINFEKAINEADWQHVITGLLREVDPNIDPMHISHLPAQKQDDDNRKEDK